MTRLNPHQTHLPPSTNNPTTNNDSFLHNFFSCCNGSDDETASANSTTSYEGVWFVPRDDKSTSPKTSTPRTLSPTDLKNSILDKRYDAFRKKKVGVEEAIPTNPLTSPKIECLSANQSSSIKPAAAVTEASQLGSSRHGSFASSDSETSSVTDTVFAMTRE